jgi:alanyl-tRNA synthetase
VQQRGSVVAADHLRFDFCHIRSMTEDEIRQVGWLVNAEIRRNRSVYDEEMSYNKAVAEGVIALFGEKYGETVRALKIGIPPISAELCGGTHVGATGEIGFFYIKSESGIGTGLRRIEAVSGRGAEEIISKKMGSQLDEIARLADELDEEYKKRQSLEREMVRLEAESLLASVETVNGIKVLASRVAPTHLDNLRQMSDFLREKLGSGVLVLGTVYQGKPVFLSSVTSDLVIKGYHAGRIINEVTAITGGSGGGKPGLAQGGGGDSKKLDEAFKAVKGLI